jgi:hypothetical protein
MTFKMIGPIRIALAAAMLGATLVAAQATQGAVYGPGESHAITVVATVQSLDPATRHLVLTSGGESFPMVADRHVQNFDQLKVGDKVKATYRLETEFLLSKPNEKLPANAEAMIAARAAKGQMPAGAVAHHMVVTGAVLGVDVANHTLKVVDRTGGKVHTIDVIPSNRPALALMKVGDYITAYVTESLLVTVHRD